MGTSVGDRFESVCVIGARAALSRLLISSWQFLRRFIDEALTHGKPAVCRRAPVGNLGRVPRVDRTFTRKCCLQSRRAPAVPASGMNHARQASGPCPKLRNGRCARSAGGNSPISAARRASAGRRTGLEGDPAMQPGGGGSFRRSPRRASAPHGVPSPESSADCEGRLRLLTRGKRRGRGRRPMGPWARETGGCMP